MATVTEDIMTNHPSKKVEYPKLPREKSKRVKIPLSDHESIRFRVLNNRAGVREIAREYGVDKRLIQFIVWPERKEQNLKRRAERGGWKKYYDKDKNTEYMRRHRIHKHELQHDEFRAYENARRREAGIIKKSDEAKD